MRSGLKVKRLTNPKSSEPAVGTSVTPRTAGTHGRSLVSLYRLEQVSMHNRPVQPPAQPCLVASPLLVSRRKLVLELDHLHLHQVLLHSKHRRRLEQEIGAEYGWRAGTLVDNSDDHKTAFKKPVKVWDRLQPSHIVKKRLTSPETLPRDYGQYAVAATSLQSISHPDPGGLGHSIGSTVDAMPPLKPNPAPTPPPPPHPSGMIPACARSTHTV